MTRVPEITKREDVSPPYRHLFDEIADSRGGAITGPFRVLLYSPIAAARTAQLGAYVRFESSLPDRVHSLAAMAVARELDCHYEWTVNEGGARRAGIPDEAVDAIKLRRAPEGLSGDDLLVFTFANDLLKKHRVDEETWKAMHDRYGMKIVTETVAAVGYYACIAMALNAFEVDPERPSTLPME
jgi:4-carboxymuconolactone decarboxylase